MSQEGSEYDTVEEFPSTPDEIKEEWSNRDPKVWEYDRGMVVRFRRGGRKYEPLEGIWYYVPDGFLEGPDVESGDVHPAQRWWKVEGSYRWNERERRAHTIAVLDENTDFWRKDATTTDAIPVCVAVDGQKAIAAYLFAIQRMGKSGIADRMGKSENTIQQYLSDYKAGRSG